MALILVVADSADARNTLSVLLTRAGHAAVVAFRSADALRIVQQHQPALVLLDMQMSGADGLSLLASLPRDGAMTVPPVVVICSVDEQELRESGPGVWRSGILPEGRG